MIDPYSLLKFLIFNYFVYLMNKLLDGLGNLEMCCATIGSFDGCSMLAMFCGIKSGLA